MNFNEFCVDFWRYVYASSGVQRVAGHKSAVGTLVMRRGSHADLSTVTCKRQGGIRSIDRACSTPGPPTPSNNVRCSRGRGPTRRDETSVRRVRSKKQATTYVYTVYTFSEPLRASTHRHTSAPFKGQTGESSGDRRE